MKEGTQSTINEGPIFTAGNHLRVQEQIEKRAHELWHTGGRSEAPALDNWLRAEREVVEQFILAYDRRHSVRQDEGAMGTGGWFHIVGFAAGE